MFSVLKHVSFLKLFLNTFYANTHTHTHINIQIVNVGVQSFYMFLDTLLVQLTEKELILILVIMS